jgi:ribosomal protein S1
VTLTLHAPENRIQKRIEQRFGVKTRALRHTSNDTWAGGAMSATQARSQMEDGPNNAEAFLALLEKSFQAELKPGVIVVGEILSVSKDGLWVDIGGKSEGFVPIREVPVWEGPETLQDLYCPGHVVELFLLRTLDERNNAPAPDAYYHLSLKRVQTVKSWEQLFGFRESQETVDAHVIGITKGGILAQVLDLKGFIPASQLRVAKPPTELIGEVLPVKILEVDKNKNKLILSHRAAVFEQKALMRAETLKRLQEGEVVTGDIVKVTDFGVFVDIFGIDGLLPLSEISWSRLKHPSEALALGQTVTVQVLSVDQALQRISLSLKRMQPDPWSTVETKFVLGQPVSGPVTKLLATGVLVELTPGVEAFCPYQPTGKFYEVGHFYHFEVVSIAAHERRMTLAYRGLPESDTETAALQEATTPTAAVHAPERLSPTVENALNMLPEMLPQAKTREESRLEGSRKDARELALV